MPRACARTGLILVEIRSGDRTDARMRVNPPPHHFDALVRRPLRGKWPFGRGQRSASRSKQPERAAGSYDLDQITPLPDQLGDRAPQLNRFSAIATVLAGVLVADRRAAMGAMHPTDG